MNAKDARPSNTQRLSVSGSIGRRLAILLAAIAALLAFLSWSMVTRFAQEAAQRSQDSVLSASAASIAEALRAEGGEIRLELPYAAFSMLAALGEDRVFYRILADGQTLTGYDDLTPPEIPETRGPTRGQTGLATFLYRGESVRAASVQRTVLAAQAPVSVLVVVAQTRSGVQTITAGLSQGAALLSLGLFALAVVLAVIATRSSLKPLNDIAQAVGRRGADDLRPVRRAVPAELFPLLAALNRLMTRLGTAIRQSEDFITEAAHRVRTPLATLRAEAEIALHSSVNDRDRAGLRRMIRAVDESARSASQLLDHATVSFRAEALARDVIDLPDLVNRVVTALAPQAELRDIEIRVETHPARVRGDTLLLESALRNVLDNALKYAPADTEVRLRCAVQGGYGVVTVCDSGPGFGIPDPQRLTARFVRGVDVGAVIGSGLGLTIASEALRAHGGSIALWDAGKGNADTGDSDKGGACVQLSLPLG